MRHAFRNIDKVARALLIALHTAVNGVPALRHIKGLAPVGWICNVGPTPDGCTISMSEWDSSGATPESLMVILVPRNSIETPSPVLYV
jgi:hypothetical protein